MARVLPQNRIFKGRLFYFIYFSWGIQYDKYFISIAPIPRWYKKKSSKKDRGEKAKMATFISIFSFQQKKVYKNYWFLLSSAELSHAICQEIKKMRILLHWDFQTIFNVTQKSICTHLNSIQYPSDMGELVTNGVRNGCIRNEKQRGRKLKRRRKCWFRYSEVTWIICGEKFLISWSKLNKLFHFYFFMPVNSDCTLNSKKTTHNGDFCWKLQ